MTEDEKEGIVTVYQETIKRLLILRLNIEVRDDGVCLQLPPLQRSPRRIPFNTIDETRIATYSATTYSGWVEASDYRREVTWCIGLSEPRC